MRMKTIADDLLHGAKRAACAAAVATISMAARDAVRRANIVGGVVIIVLRVAE